MDNINCAKWAHKILISQLQFTFQQPVRWNSSFVLQRLTRVLGLWSVRVIKTMRVAAGMWVAVELTCVLAEIPWVGCPAVPLVLSRITHGRKDVQHAHPPESAFATDDAGTFPDATHAIFGLLYLHNVILVYHIRIQWNKWIITASQRARPRAFALNGYDVSLH